MIIPVIQMRKAQSKVSEYVHRYYALHNTCGHMPRIQDFSVPSPTFFPQYTDANREVGSNE